VPPKRNRGARRSREGARLNYPEDGGARSRRRERGGRKGWREHKGKQKEEKIPQTRSGCKKSS
jgi:hypothetical protein